jgi:anthranilate phosphoribosyltransferase
MKQVLSRLYDHDTLSRQEARDILRQVAEGVFNDVQIAAFVTTINMRPITLNELQGFREAMLELCVKIDLDHDATIDIVGTGGDGKNTFNISTLACVVVAGAGYPVSKQGSVGVSSTTGSSDVLSQLGYQLTNEQDRLKRYLHEAGICFMHAPLFHPALKTVIPVRRQLGTKTFFNILGPLVNPLQPRYQLFGVYSLELLRLYQYIMQQSKGRDFGVIHAYDGYDEVSLTGALKFASRHHEEVLSPAHFGLSACQQQDLDGGQNSEEAAKIFWAVLKNEATPAQKNAVAANAALAIRVIKPQQSLQDCVAEALESIEAGKALQTWNKLLALVNA